MAQPLRLPAGILFDLDDTIIDYSVAEDDFVDQASREAPLRTAGVTAVQLRGAIDSHLRRFWSDPAWARRSTGSDSSTRNLTGAILRAALVELGVDDPRFTERLTEQYRALRASEMRLVPGAFQTLSRLRERGIRLALVTNGGATSQRAKVDRFGLAPYFSYILIEGEFGAGKPEPRVYATAVQQLGCRTPDAWMVGDDLYNDVAAPQRLGLTGVWVDARGAGLLPDAPTTPDRIIRSIQELTAI